MSKKVKKFFGVQNSYPDCPNRRSEKYGVRRQAKGNAALDGVATQKLTGNARKSGVALRLPPHSIAYTAESFNRIRIVLAGRRTDVVSYRP